MRTVGIVWGLNMGLSACGTHQANSNILGTTSTRDGQLANMNLDCKYRGTACMAVQQVH